MIKPWLWIPPQLIHSLAPGALRALSKFYPSAPLIWRPLRWRGIDFPNPLGPAGGTDKNGTNTLCWQNFGAGFCEAGTVTPLPQKANPGPTLKRNLKHRSLWNHLGFPNKGLDFVQKQLSASRGKNKIPLFVNVGKNRHTPLSRSVEDYIKGIRALHPFADVFVINISSPNTKDLRALFEDRHLLTFLKTLREETDRVSAGKPLILKISPDLEDERFHHIIDTSLKAGVDGWCLCNSTVRRTVKNLFPENGGVSGKLLADRSLTLLKQLKKRRDSFPDKLIVSCGGVLTSEDVLERLNEGADLVQIYSALVFSGPGFFRSVFKRRQKSSC